MYSRRIPPSLLICIVLFLGESKNNALSIASKIFNSDNPATEISNDLLHLHFSALKNSTELKSVLANIVNYDAILELSNLNWDSLPLYYFQNISLHTLVIANSTFQTFRNASLDYHIRRLHQLTLENVTFYERPRWEEFSVLSKLKKLFLYNTTLEKVITNTFGHHLSKSVESLTVAECNITDIKADSFRELKNLTDLRISHNKLRSFPKLILTRTPKLKQLRLDYNRIHFLPSGVFNNLLNLKILSLSNNSISTLPEDVFSSLWRSDALVELRDNPIKCDCRILWIVTSQTKPRNLIGRCAHPKHLYGRDLKDLKIEDLNC